jgi:hypothetical protein
VQPVDYDAGSGYDQSGLHSDRVQAAPSQSADCTPTGLVNRRGLEEGVEEKRLQPAARSDSFPENSYGDTAQSQNQKILQPVAKDLNSNDYQAEFRKAFAETFDGELPVKWSPMEQRQSKLCRKDFKSDADYLGYINFAVRNWSEVRASITFTTIEELPSMRALSTQWIKSKFMEAFIMRRQRPDAFDASTSAQIKRRKLSGLNHDQAVASVAEEQGRNKAMAELKKGSKVAAESLVAEDMANEARLAEKERKRREAVTKPKNSEVIDTSDWGESANNVTPLTFENVDFSTDNWK